MSQIFSAGQKTVLLICFTVICVATWGILKMTVPLQAKIKLRENLNLLPTNFGSYYYHRQGQFSLLPEVPGAVIFLGDSLTEMGNWSEWGSSSKILNRGISGDSTMGVHQRLAEIIRHRPTKIFLLIGVNDLEMGYSAKHALEYSEKILSDLKTALPQTQIFITLLAPVGKDHENSQILNQKIVDYNRELKVLVEKFKTPWIDLHTPLLSPQGLYLDPQYTLDQTHFTGTAYQKWWGLVAAYL